MDISVQRLQFLDLTDLAENDQTFIEQVLFSKSRTLEVPWSSGEACNECLDREWCNALQTNALEASQQLKEETLIEESHQEVSSTGGKCERAVQLEGTIQKESPACQGAQKEQLQQRGNFPCHPSASLPHQPQLEFQMYQMLPSIPSVYVSNVTANVSVHAPYVQTIPAHYNHQISPQPQQTQTQQHAFSQSSFDNNDQGNRNRRQRQKSDKKREVSFAQTNEVIASAPAPSIDGHPPPQFTGLPPLAPYYLPGNAGTPVYVMPVYTSPVFGPYAHTPNPMVYPQTGNLEHGTEEYHGNLHRNFQQENSGVVVLGCSIRSDAASDQRRSLDANGGNYAAENRENTPQEPPPFQSNNLQNSLAGEGDSKAVGDASNALAFRRTCKNFQNASKEDFNGNYYDGKVTNFSSQKQCASNEKTALSRSELKKDSCDVRAETAAAQKTEWNGKQNVNIVNNIISANSDASTKHERFANENTRSAKEDAAAGQAETLDQPGQSEERPGTAFPKFSPAGFTSDVSSEVKSSAGGKSWASLFNRSGEPFFRNSTSDDQGRPLARVQPYSERETERVSCARVPPSSLPSLEAKRETLLPVSSEGFSPNGDPVEVFEDPYLHNLGAFLCKYELEHKIVSLQPRGLTNRNNWCYVNAILQSLIACPPFYNLLKALPVGLNKKGNKHTEIVDALVEYVNEFSPMPANTRIGKREKSARNKDEANVVDIVTAPAFEPSGIYKILNKVRGGGSFNVEGRQEDAEEFLSCLLNGLNDEMFELMKLVDSNKESVSNGNASDFAKRCTEDDEDDDDDNSEWNVMGPKNKSSITRRAVCGKTPVSDIFRGQFRSRVQRAGDQSTDTVQPFFTLQLDIEKANSVKDALESLMGKDPLEGVTCSKTHQEVEAWTQTTLEDLPLVLILHLKCYDYKSDACSKIIKNFDFQVDLKIDAKLLSNRNKYTGKQRNYKLVAVVYHDGKEANKGHYVTDAYHVGYGCWLRYDDVIVRPVPESHVLKPRAPRVPYLLYYRRADTIGFTK